MAGQIFHRSKRKIMKVYKYIATEEQKTTKQPNKYKRKKQGNINKILSF
jgi:thioredoxin-related protein